jgi:hypothetical protein
MKDCHLKDISKPASAMGHIYFMKIYVENSASIQFENYIINQYAMRGENVGQTPHPFISGDQFDTMPNNS